MNYSLRIIFAGTPSFGLPSLNALHQSEHNICAVYTQPDRPAGRGRRLQLSSVKEWALAHHYPVYQPANFKSDEAIEALLALKADVMVVIAYGLILPKIVLNAPRLGCVNVHASLLPRWRGASPIQQAICSGDTQSGVTIMQMDEGMDTGAMLQSVPCAIAPNDTAATLHDRLSILSAAPLLDCLHALVQGSLSPTPQDDSQASYAPKIIKDDAKINWDQPSATIDCIIRGYNPWPMAYCHYQDSNIKVLSGSILAASNAAHPPGTIVRIDKQGIAVACKEGVYNIEQLQIPGRKAMSVAQWLNGSKQRIKVGETFSG